MKTSGFNGIYIQKTYSMVILDEKRSIVCIKMHSYTIIIHRYYLNKFGKWEIENSKLLTLDEAYLVKRFLTKSNI